MAETRGFSLVEVAVVSGLLAIMAVIAVPKLQESMRISRVRAEVRRMASAVKEARMNAMRHQEIEGTTARARSSGLRILDERQYESYVTDTRDGLGGDCEVCPLTVRHFQIPEEIGLRIDIPPGEIRFKQDGVLDTENDGFSEITFQDVITGRMYRFIINATGSVRHF